MKKEEFSKIKNKVVAYVEGRRLRDAFHILRQLSEKKLTWEITDEINRVEEAYTLMLRYAMQGADDPSRAEVYEGIRADVLSLLDRIERATMEIDEPTLYYNVVRYERGQKSDSIASLLSACSEKWQQVEELGAAAPKDLRQELERLENRLFNRVWTTYPLRSEDVAAIGEVFANHQWSASIGSILVGALLLGALQFFDEARLRLLMDAVDPGEEGFGKTSNPLTSSGLVVLLLLLYTYRTRQLSRRTLQRLDALREQKGWRENLRIAFLELIRTRDTDRLTRKLRDEVVPEMMKLRPDITRKLDLNDPDALNPELNPEWEDRLRKSGIADKLKELSEIQEEGGDIYMATFGSLKNFPFFSDIANWFRPFDSHNSAINAHNPLVGSITSVLDTLPTLCDSDKYSLAFAVSHFPDSQAQMLSSQLDVQMEQLKEMMDGETPSRASGRRTEINNYVKNLFRFFRLFRRSGEFFNPLDTKLNLTAIPWLVDDLNDPDTLRVVGEFFFTREYHAEAFEVFTILEQTGTSSAELYQKMGFCRQQLADLVGALDYYERAELLDATSVWTIRRLAQVSKMLGRPSQALEYYRRLDQLKPDSVATSLNMGHCLVEMARFADALKAYRKAEYLDENGTRHLRPVAWCLFMLGQFDQAADYYDRVLASGASPTDYLNMGHLALARRNFKDALNFYRLNVETRQKDGIDGFIVDLRADADYLKQAGVDTAILPLVIDALLYARK